MNFWNLKNLSEATGGEIISSVETDFSRITIDTRDSIGLETSVFVALRGENFNGHDFLEDALENKAHCLIVDELRNPLKGISIIKVNDTLKALQDLASFYRKKKAFKVLAITGSVGKTTTKNYTYSLLSRHKKVFTVEKSFNNDVGVPLVLLQAPEDSESVILEIGTNKKGEIERLTKLASPDQTVITKISLSHAQSFPTLDDVVEEKKQIYTNSPDSLQIFNLDQEELRELYFQAKKGNRKTLTFSHYYSQADVYLKIKDLSLNHLVVEGHIKEQQDKAVIPIFGAQNITNLMAACCLSLGEGLTPRDIWKNLNLCKNSWGRSDVFLLENKATVLFDAYNSSLMSSKSLFENIKNLNWKGKKYLVLGEMNELGEHTKAHHEKLAHLVEQDSWEKVWFLGDCFPLFQKSLKNKSFELTGGEKNEGYEMIAEELIEKLKPGDLLTFKGSRNINLEKISNILKKTIV